MNDMKELEELRSQNARLISERFRFIEANVELGTELTELMVALERIANDTHTADTEKDEAQAVLVEARRRAAKRAARAPQGPVPAGGESRSKPGRMVQLDTVLAELHGIFDDFGNTCVYIRDMSWGAVALNRKADDDAALAIKSDAQ